MLRLSDAIHLGSTLIGTNGGCPENCAIGMAIKATGDPQPNVVAKDYYFSLLRDRWPYMANAKSDCPQCGQHLEGSMTLTHVFNHVQGCSCVTGEIMTFEAFLDYVVSMEPEQEEFILTDDILTDIVVSIGV